MMKPTLKNSSAITNLPNRHFWAIRMSFKFDFGGLHCRNAQFQFQFGSICKIPSGLMCNFPLFNRDQSNRSRPTFILSIVLLLHELHCCILYFFFTVVFSIIRRDICLKKDFASLLHVGQ